MTDNTTGFARTSKSKADFLDFIASIFYAQNCNHCRSIQGVCLILVSISMFASSTGVVGALNSFSNNASIMLGYIGGFVTGAGVVVVFWLVFFALFKSVTNEIANNAPEIPTGIVTDDDYAMLDPETTLDMNDNDGVKINEQT